MQPYDPIICERCQTIRPVAELKPMEFNDGEPSALVCRDEEACNQRIIVQAHNLVDQSRLVLQHDGTIPLNEIYARLTRAIDFLDLIPLGPGAEPMRVHPRFLCVLCQAPMSTADGVCKYCKAQGRP